MNTQIKTFLLNRKFYFWVRLVTTLLLHLKLRGILPSHTHAHFVKNSSIIVAIMSREINGNHNVKNYLLSENSCIDNDLKGELTAMHVTEF